MIDIIVNLFADIADFLVDLWINKITSRKKKHKDLDKEFIHGKDSISLGHSF